MTELEEKLSDYYQVRVSETLKKKVMNLPLPKRKTLAAEVRYLLRQAIAKAKD